MSDLGNKCRALGLDFIFSEDESRVIFTRDLTEAEDEIYLNILFPNRAAQLARKTGARNQAALAEQFKTATPQQAADYVVQQITNGVPEAQALNAFDNATTFAAAKPILRNMLVGMYRTVDILKLVARILVALRDATWPDLPES